MHCSRNPAKGTNEQHPARHSLSGSAVLGCYFVRSRIRRFRFAVFGKQLGADCAIHANYTLCGPPVQSGWACRPQQVHGRRPDDELLSSRPAVPARRSWPYLPFGSRVKRRRGQNHQGQNRRGPKRSAARALRACAWHQWDRGPAPTKASRAYKRSATAAHKPPRPAGPGAAGLRRAAESLWPAGSPDDRISDGPPGIFHLGRRCTGAWAADGPHRERPYHRGRFCCARPRDMDARSTWRLPTGWTCGTQWP